MNGFEAKRIAKEFTHRIESSPDRIFPLLCPVREYEWIDGWSSQMVYSESGVAEKHCVFETELPELGRLTWMVSLYDPVNHEIEFVITRQGSHVEKLEIAVRDSGDGTSAILWRRIYTGLSENGNGFIETHSGQPLSARMARLERSMNHFFKTGELLRSDA